MLNQLANAIKIFYCYSCEDDALREQLARHLSPLRRLRYITGWYNRDIQAGTNWEREIQTHLDAANIVLLLLSADFFASDYQYAEMQRALAKHKAGMTYVIPILLRPVSWEETPLGELSVLPTNKKPVTQWANQDEAWLNIVEGIKDVIGNVLSKQTLSGEELNILYPNHGPLSGQIIGEKYLLGGLIGEGGFSQVYKAQHLQIRRLQAIKVLLQHLFRKQEFRDRLLREAQTVASLDHPNIIHLDDFWIDDLQAYLVMPFIKGGTLQDILESQGILEHEKVLFYLECLCSALDYAHERGVVHLDLKPQNLLVYEDGKLLLTDFGLAHFMKKGAVVGGSSLRGGTPHYMAPEHIRGFPEKRSDIFSLGVILYQMLVGQLPFSGQSPETILLKNLTEKPPTPRSLRPDLSQTVQTILFRALAKKPEQRYQTANELLIALKKVLVPEKIAAQSTEHLLLSYAYISTFLERAIEDNYLLMSGGYRLAPTAYDIYLCPKDYYQLLPAENALIQNWKEHLIRFARQKHYTMRVEPVVRLYAKRELRVGAAQINVREAERIPTEAIGAEQLEALRKRLPELQWNTDIDI